MNRDEFIVKFPKELSEKYNVVYKCELEDSVMFFTDEASENIENALKIIFQKDIGFEVINTKLLNFKRDEFYDLGDDKLILNFSLNKNTNLNTEFSSDSEASKALDTILVYALEKRASDIHFDSQINEIVVRMRIDGILHDVSKISRFSYNLISTRIKVISNLDYTVKNKPLDGRFTFKKDDRSVDIRVAIIPTAIYEKIVLRILDKTAIDFSMDGIGLFGEDAEKVKKLVRQPSGLLLVSGPTGSGKSSTLYTLLKHIYSRELNIITVEDPVEYKIDGINQIEINKELGRGFNEGLKSILRLDPDKVMVGEIRDKETAQTALRAAITGRLVLSSIHTADSPSAIYRLRDMGIENYLISAGLIGIISQRLVRKLCDCSEPVTEYVDIFNREITHYKPVGCKKCRNGYVGRTAVFEILILNDELKEAIVKGVSLKEFRDLCSKNMISLKDSMKHMLSSGVTSLEEIYKNVESTGEL